MMRKGTACRTIGLGPTRGSEQPGDTSAFDREFVVDSFSPPDAEARRRWQRARRKRGRPIVGNGVKVISVSIERGLLARADRLAKKRRVSRAFLISRGLQAVLAAERVKPP